MYRGLKDGSMLGGFGTAVTGYRMLSRHNGSRYTRAQVQKTLRATVYKNRNHRGPIIIQHGGHPPALWKLSNVAISWPDHAGARGTEGTDDTQVSVYLGWTQYTHLSKPGSYLSIHHLSRARTSRKRSFTPIKPQKGEICPVQFKKDHTSVLRCSSSGQLGARQVPVAAAFHGFSFCIFFFRQFLYNSSTALE